MNISQAAFHKVTVGATQAGALGENQGSPRRIGTERFDPARVAEGEEEHLDPHVADVDGVERMEKTAARRRGERGAQAGEAGKPGRSGGTAEARPTPTPQAEGDDYLNPAVRAALNDNSRELQIRFEQTRPQDQQVRGPEAGSRAATRLMLDRLVHMTKDRLAQHTGDEPYSKGDYRALQGALEGIRSQYGDSWAPKDEPEDPWDAAERREGPALDSGMDRAGEVLAWFGQDDAEEQDEPERLDLVA